MRKYKNTFVKRIFVIFIFLTAFYQSYGQNDYEWWNEAHNYDGYTHWTNYIIYSPYYLGPNALPVPGVKRGF